MPRNALNLTGQRNGIVTAIERVENSKRGQAVWKLKCDCGGEIFCTSAQFKTKTHCGCKSKENISKAAKNSYKSGRINPNQTHGMSKTKLHNSWRGMRERCSNPNHLEYHNYGGRGIIVCDDWNISFESFMLWANANNYQEGLSIDRIDNNKGYYPDNCKWSTRKEQGNNMTTNRVIELFGETKTLKQWCEKLNLKYDTIRARLNRGVDKYEAFR